jgi:hypothetical protein
VGLRSTNAALEVVEEVKVCGVERFLFGCGVVGGADAFGRYEEVSIILP